MNTRKRNMVSYIATGLLICFSLSMGSTVVQAATGGKLMLSLQPGLDGEGDVKATSITKAELTSPDGIVMINGDVSGGTVQFNLSGIDAGDYFIRVNDLADDLVPTRIDDTATAINQFVGQKLRVTVIGNLSDPTYRIQTFSKGQGEHPVVIYSDGSNDIPEQYAYVLLSLKTSPQTLEINVLGTASQLNSYLPTAAIHPSTSTAINPAFSDWMLGENNHAYDYNGTDSKCKSCHINLDTKPAAFTQITTSNGWCYRCHYGKAGVDNGFIDATALSAATPMPTTPITATGQPTATTKTPAFEALLAISALLITVLSRKR
ncbi:Uncharacterised protein [uncultured archaeon]|nr:Uncharacterised protein [uncultured archaeon]